MDFNKKIDLRHEYPLDEHIHDECLLNVEKIEIITSVDQIESILLASLASDFATSINQDWVQGYFKRLTKIALQSDLS